MSEENKNLDQENAQTNGAEAGAGAASGAAAAQEGQAKGEPSIRKIGEDQPQEQQRSFNLQRTYLKESSLEMPNAPHIFMAEENPQYEISVNIGAEPLSEKYFHSLVRATVHAKIGQHTLYMLEGTQAGIFEISGFEVQEIDQLLGIVCPANLFNYLRVNLADMVTRTGLPQLNLADINFQALYEQNLQARIQEAQQQQAAQQASGAEGAGGTAGTAGQKAN